MEKSEYTIRNIVEYHKVGSIINRDVSGLAKDISLKKDTGFDRIVIPPEKDRIIFHCKKLIGVATAVENIRKYIKQYNDWAKEKEEKIANNKNNQ